ncbi:MAG: tyrosine-type recombinase/integrase [Dehalococcoidales bacterium]|jgi:integrase/recombinase XerC
MAEQADAADLKPVQRMHVASRKSTAQGGVLSNVLSNFFESRREGLSLNTRDFYEGYLRRAGAVIGFNVTSHDINQFIKALPCSNGGKHAYFRVLKTFYNWFYSPKAGYGLKLSDNPILGVDAPKQGKKILPSLTLEQVDYIIDQAGRVRDKAIVSLFNDSGLRLEELTNINPQDIDWNRRLIKVRGKGNKEGYALFGERTAALLKEWLEQRPADSSLWHIGSYTIADMLEKLSAKTGITFSAHTFRRTFASILAKRGVDSLHIMRLGRWESIAMVERYTRSVRFEDSMKFYAAIVN